jgi:hypothetical protein
MARAPAKTKETGTAVATWDEELAAEAAAAEAQEASAGGAQFISLRGGILSYGGNAMNNNEMAVIIIASRLENVFYEGNFDPDTPQAPTCYAFGKDEKDMAPHPNVFEASNQQHDTCAGCEMNEWGSADTGRGKACRNSRRIVIIPGGAFNQNGQFLPPDEGVIANAQEAFMRLPVTSVKAYANYIKGVANGALGRKLPPYAVFTKIKVTPDASTQFKVNFTALGEVPNDLIGAIRSRRDAAEAIIETPYPKPEDAPPPPPARNARASKAAPKAPARRAGR